MSSSAQPLAVDSISTCRRRWKRRTMSQWLNLLIATGFLMERMEEPRPTDETVRACPDMQDAQVVAYFLHIRARKPE
jgi:hypothetical protein